MVSNFHFRKEHSTFQRATKGLATAVAATAAIPTSLRTAVALLLAASLPAVPAWAGCGNAADFNASLSDNTAGGAPGTTATGTSSVDAGTVITWTITLTRGGPSGTVTIQPLISPGGVDNGVIKTGSVGGTVQFTASATGSYGFEVKLDGGAGTVSATLTASCGGAGGGGSSDASSGTDAGVRTTDGGRLPELPGEFPDAGTEDDLVAGEIAEIDAQLSEIDQQISAIKDKLEELTRASEELAENLRIAEQSPFLSSDQREEAKKAIIFEIDVTEARIDDLRKGLDIRQRQRTSLDQRRRELKGDFTPANVEDLGDSEVILRNRFNPVFVSSRSFATNGPSNLWTRLKITSLNGTLGRGGLAVHGQLGLVWPTANGGSVGSFLSLFRASTSSSTLGTSNTATGLGLGGYYKFPLSSRLTGGISASYERSSNSTNNGTGTGSYARDLATLNASVSTTRRLGMITWTPSASLSYTYSNRHAYTDSTATLIPARIEQALVASGSLNGSRVFVVRSPRVRLLTLSGGITVSANLSGSDTIAFSSGATVASSAWSASVNGSASWLMKNGGALSIGANIGGIGASVQSYSASLRYDLRF